MQTGKRQPANTIFLSEGEIRRLIDTDLPGYRQIRNCFLFACQTGLRYCDVISLKFKHIETDEKDGSYYINSYRTKKTGKYTKLKLKNLAAQIIDEQRAKGSEFVFPLGCTQMTVNRQVKKWALLAGIDERKAAKMSFHKGRHSFGTLALKYNDNNIYLVSRLMGHSNVKMTEIYAKLIDKSLEDAIDSLPDF
jgi:integrase